MVEFSKIVPTVCEAAVQNFVAPGMLYDIDMGT